MPFPLFLSSERSRMRATWLRIPRDGSWLTQSVVVSLWSLIPPIQVLHVHNSWFHSKSAIINVIMSTTQLYSCHDILISSYFMSPCLKYWYSHPPNFPYKYSPICPISPKKTSHHVLWSYTPIASCYSDSTSNSNYLFLLWFLLWFMQISTACEVILHEIFSDGWDTQFIVKLWCFINSVILHETLQWRWSFWSENEVYYPPIHRNHSIL